MRYSRGFTGQVLRRQRRRRSSTGAPEPLGGARLRRDYAAPGSRYLTLTHSLNTTRVDPSTDTPAHDGLTPFGKDVARELSRSASWWTFSVVVERDPEIGSFVGHVPGSPGAHSQGESLDELQANLQEVVSMLLEDGEPKFESEFVAVHTIKVA
jgi:predicted RNase H-like HicB family nuclease